MPNKSVGSVYMDLDLDSKSFDKGIQHSKSSAENAMSISMKKISGYIASAFSVVAVTQFAKSSINAASQMQSAWTGLNSIVEGTGKSFSTAENFINKFTSDGLISINEATTAYKNLLSRGYDTTQIEDTMSRLKDSAAFGRQASYDLGEAVVTATEGLKNENSILVDNAGVTKNVAKMWEEYAKAHNITTNAMTQAQKIEAEYQGIMQETKFQVGDAANYTRTYAGQIQKLKMSFTNLQVAVGRVVAPIAQLFIPVINTAVVSVTNLFNRIGDVLKAFGISFPNVISKAGQSAINTATDIASTGDAAVKAAKKINKAFADVDEISVVSANNNSSNSDTFGVASSSVAIEPTVATDSAVSSAVQATVDKIRKYIQPLQDIKFDNLINAFSNLKISVEPIIKTIGDILSWLYFNILVPFAKWTIEEAMPAFFNALAGAFKILNPVLTAFKDLGIWLWDKFLQPIASWTGGAIVSVLEDVGNKLSKIGDWMSENQSVVDAITFSVAGFFGAWKVVELMSFIQQSGGVIKCLTDMWTWIKLVTIEKVKDKLETMILNAMYAKDFIKNIISSTAALIKQGAAWVLVNGYMVIYNATTAIGTAATTAFGVAMSILTNPITLVVLGITALIAIIVLCVKHWDDIKNAASKCWDGIKSVWSSVSNWFNSKVVQPISNIFNGLGNSLMNAFKSPINFIIDGINTFLKGINKIKLPSWVPGIGGAGFNFTPIQRLAQGKYVEANNPQLAIVGDNTREGEVITPESKIYEQQMRAIKDSGLLNGSGGGIAEVHLYVHYEDGKVIIQKINKAQVEAGEILLLT